MIHLLTSARRQSILAVIPVLLFLLLSHSLLSQVQHQIISLNDKSQSVIQSRSGDNPSEQALNAIQMRGFQLNPTLQSANAVEADDVILLDLFDTKQYRARVDKVFEEVNGTTVLRARIEGSEYGFCIITTTNGISSMIVEVPERNELFQTTYDPQSGSHLLLEVAKDRNLPLQEGTLPFQPMVKRATAHAHPTLDRVENNRDVEVNVLVVYTPAAKEWSAANESGIENTISVMMERSQLSMDNSEVGIRLNLVHTAEVPYQESASMRLDLRRLARNGEGYMDDAHVFREQFSADLVMLLQTSDEFGGLAYLFTGEASTGFGITRVQQASTTYTGAHEFGHNFGCHHHRDQNFQPGPGYHDYSAGWRWSESVVEHYCTLMTYERGQYFDDLTTHTAVAHFSNPSVRYNGLATGDPILADNAHTLRQTKSVIATFSDQGPGVDLELTDQTVSQTTVSPGDEIQATIKVTNIGDWDADEVKLAYFFSTDEFLDEFDKVLAEESVPALVSEEFFEQGATLKIPENALSGVHYLFFVTDVDDRQEELNEFNNSDYIEIEVINGALPTRDLLISSQSATNTAVVAGDDNEVTVGVTNTGNVNIGISSVAFMLSKDQSFDEADLLLSNSDNTVVPAGATASLSQSITIPPSVAPGEYYLLLVADYQEQVQESDESNNVAFLEMTILENGAVPADVVIESTFSTSTEIRIGEPLDLTFDLSNIGETTTSSVGIAYLLSKDSEQDASDLLVALSTTEALEAGQEITVEESITLPNSVDPGPWNLLVVVDYYQHIAESDETNNLIFFGLQVNPSFVSIDAINVPSEGGTVNGIGDFSAGETVVLVAEPAQSFAFVNWTEDGIEVSTEIRYEFDASEDRNLVANFNRVVSVDPDRVAAHKVYPNPFTSQLQVEWPDFLQLQIMNMSGKEVFRSDEPTVDLGELTKGVYLLILTGQDGERVNLKVMKE